MRLASCMFEESAAFWWDAALRSDFVDREFNTITWEEFMEVFNVKYFPEQLRDQKSKDFSNLKQGELSVRDYEQKFIQLERFAPGLCANEKARANKFVWGLRFTLKDRVVNQRPQTLANAVAIACLSEEVLDEQYGPLQKKEKNKNQNNNSGGNKGANNQPQQAQKTGQNNFNKRKTEDNQQNKREKPVCPTCNKKHAGECWKNNPKCFNCGELGHIRKNCQRNKREYQPS